MNFEPTPKTVATTHPIILGQPYAVPMIPSTDKSLWEEWVRKKNIKCEKEKNIKYFTRSLIWESYFAERPAAGGMINFKICVYSFCFPLENCRQAASDETTTR